MPDEVLLLTDNMRIGGVQKVVAMLANGIVEGGRFSVSVAASADGPLWGEISAQVVRLDSLPQGSLPIRLFRQVRWLRKVLLARRPILIHSHQRGVSLVARLASFRLGIPVVEHVHNEFRRRPWDFVSFRGKSLIACSEMVATMLRAQYGLDEGRVTTVVNAVPDPGFYAPPIAEPERPIRIAIIARASEQKDPMRAVRICKILQEADANIQVRWVGDGELLESAKREVSVSGITKLSFIGAASNVQAHVLWADALWLTSRWEGLPLTILEAASLSRGAVVPDVGGCAEAVLNGITGFVYHRALPDEELAALIQRLADSELFRRWGEAARKRYETHYTLKRYVNQIENVYDKTIRGS